MKGNNGGYYPLNMAPNNLPHGRPPFMPLQPPAGVFRRPNMPMMPPLITNPYHSVPPYLQHGALHHPHHNGAPDVNIGTNQAPLNPLESSGVNPLLGTNSLFGGPSSSTTRMDSAVSQPPEPLPRGFHTSVGPMEQCKKNNGPSNPPSFSVSQPGGPPGPHPFTSSEEEKKKNVYALFSKSASNAERGEGEREREREPSRDENNKKNTSRDSKKRKGWDPEPEGDNNKRSRPSEDHTKIPFVAPTTEPPRSKAIIPGKPLQPSTARSSTADKSRDEDLNRPHPKARGLKTPSQTAGDVLNMKGQSIRFTKLGGSRVVHEVMAPPPRRMDAVGSSNNHAAVKEEEGEEEEELQAAGEHKAHASSTFTSPIGGGKIPIINYDADVDTDDLECFGEDSDDEDEDEDEEEEDEEEKAEEWEEWEDAEEEEDAAESKVAWAEVERMRNKAKNGPPRYGSGPREGLWTEDVQPHEGMVLVGKIYNLIGTTLDRRVDWEIYCRKFGFSIVHHFYQYLPERYSPAFLAHFFKTFNINPDDVPSHKPPPPKWTRLMIQAARAARGLPSKMQQMNKESGNYESGDEWLRIKEMKPEAARKARLEADAEALKKKENLSGGRLCHLLQKEKELMARKPGGKGFNKKQKAKKLRTLSHMISVARFAESEDYKAWAAGPHSSTAPLLGLTKSQRRVIKEQTRMREAEKANDALDLSKRIGM